MRAEHGRIYAALVGRFGDFDLAEDALADAIERAATTWANAGVPDNPAAWLTTVAVRRAIDLDRRRRNLVGKIDRHGAELASRELDDRARDAAVVEPWVSLPDDRLRLVFTCCHPALAWESQVALCLRTVLGLDVDEIGRWFLVSEAAMSKRLVRARRKIRDAGIPYRVPEDHELSDRLPGVLRSIYLLFAEGYHPTHDGVVRDPVVDAAIALAATLHGLMPDEGEVIGLHALLLLHDARRATRVDADGVPVRLDDQDRTRWDRDLIERGTALAESALRRRPAGPYALQAAIAAIHDAAPTAERTDRRQIAALYGELVAVAGGPAVELARAVAVGLGEGPEAGLTLLDRWSELHDPDLLADRVAAARGELLARAGRTGDAAAAFRRAADLAINPATAAGYRATATRLSGPAEG